MMYDFELTEKQIAEHKAQVAAINQSIVNAATALTPILRDMSNNINNAMTALYHHNPDLFLIMFPEEKEWATSIEEEA